ncbi:MAG TPA: electron transfer flavoprotein subunit beta/FixA family protein [Gammaproteobacteria bacterium]|nr:electron transfer flavoprotein subunit beta/FixA family protein [Gammaproteobacteria bacterium]
MKILVAIKRVPDFKTNIRLRADGSAIETTNVKMSMNPFDEIAVEEALRLKEKGLARELVVISIGPPATQEILRTALAMGADRAILVQTEIEIQPLQAATILASFVPKEAPELIILGKQAIDTDNNQVGQMLAGLLKWPQGTFASELRVEEKGIQVTREIDGGLETLFLKLPAVVTTDLRLNEPRYISLPNIVRAKQKPLEMHTLESLGIELSAGIKLLKLSLPEKKRHTRYLENVTELVRCLKEEAKVL